jgi:hypothetical protein
MWLLQELTFWRKIIMVTRIDELETTLAVNSDQSTLQKNTMVFARAA